MQEHQVSCADVLEAPLVSILIPVCNLEPYVEQAIGSAQAQTYPNIEILVHDDGSTDRTVEIVQRLAEGDPRIRLSRSPSNQGVAHARNQLIEQASGAYVCWLDADDMMAEDKVMAQCAFLDANPAIDAVATAFRSIDAAGRPVTPDYLLKRGDPKGRVFIPPYATVTILYRREALLRGYPLRPLKNGSDFDLVLRVAQAGAIAEMPEILYIRRHHEGQMSLRAASGHMIAVASNIYRACGLADIVDAMAIDEPALLRRILSDRSRLFAALSLDGGASRDAMTEGRFALVLVLLHAVRRIGTAGERFGVAAACFCRAPGASFKVVRFWLRRRRPVRP
jgi:glycosyltransferase involved in cell wall biosynthesis